MSSISRYLGDPPYALWSIWHQLSTLQHWLVYTLGALCIYAGYCVVSTIVRLHSLKLLGSDAVALCLGVLHSRCTNLRYASVAELYLSGIVVFMSFQFIPMFLMGNNVESQMVGKFLRFRVRNQRARCLPDPAHGSVVCLLQDQRPLRAPAAWRAVKIQFGVTRHSTQNARGRDSECNGLGTTVNFSFERPQPKILSREMQPHAFRMLSIHKRRAGKRTCTRYRLRLINITTNESDLRVRLVSSVRAIIVSRIPRLRT
jgi:hypothetical protein